MRNHVASWLLICGLVGCCWMITGCKSALPEPAFTLPPASTTGANTLGFLVDGRVWTNYGPICPGLGIGIGPCQDNQLQVLSHAAHGIRHFYVTAILATDQHHESFELTVDSVHGPGVYYSGPIAANKLFVPNNITFQDEKTFDPAKQIYTSIAPNVTRIVLTRVDTVQHIIAGTFEGRLDVIGYPNNFVSITQGRFDVTYQL